MFTLRAPPPRPQDPRTLAELEELRQVQAARTPERTAIAQADVEETIFRFTMLAAVAMNDPQFKVEFAAARAELRAALGL